MTKLVRKYTNQKRNPKKLPRIRQRRKKDKKYSRVVQKYFSLQTYESEAWGRGVAIYAFPAMDSGCTMEFTNDCYRKKNKWNIF